MVRRWVTYWFVAASIAGCGDKQAPAPPPPPPPPAPASKPAPPPAAPVPPSPSAPQPFSDQVETGAATAEATRVVTYRVTWSNVHKERHCWYFSGPDGRDTPLGDRAVVRMSDQAILAWGKARFDGTWGDKTIDVLRLARHDYGGAWMVTERLTGQVKERGIHATYTYEECQVGTDCTNPCRIAADVLLTQEP